MTTRLYRGHLTKVLRERAAEQGVTAEGQRHVASLLRSTHANPALHCTDRGMIMSVEPDERAYFQSGIVYDTRHSIISDPAFCPRCWIKKIHCVCPIVRPVGDCGVNLIVYMHAKEYARFSNTGRLLLGSFGDDRAKLFVHKIRAQEDAFYDAINDCLRRNEEIVVLFPAPDAISADDVRRRLNWPPSAAVGSSNIAESLEKLNLEGSSAASSASATTPPVSSSSSPSSSSGPAQQAAGAQDRRRLTVIVVDGTWNQASTMIKSVPATVPRVKLDPTMPSIFLLRKQSQLDRICTLEATALLLSELLGPDHEAPSKLIDTFKDVVAKQMHIKRPQRRPAAMESEQVIGDQI